MTRRKRNRPLTRDEILDEALRIIDGEGLEALTMRRLGAALRIDPMALYRHVPNKEALLDLTVERMRAEMEFPDRLPDHPAGLLEAVFMEYRRVLAAHPNMLPLATRRTDPAGTSGLQYIVDQEIPPEDAVELYQSLAAFTVGFALLSSPLVEERWAGVPEDLAERVGEWRDATFRRTLRAVMDGYGLGQREDER